MKKISIFVIVALLVACEQDEDPLKKNAIDSKIKIEPREYLDLNSRQLVLYCQTEKAYPCINYPILTEQVFQENKLSITFTSVLETDFCLTAVGPASAIINLGNMANGQYELELNNAELKNKGTLKISDSEITLDFKNQNGIEIVRQITKKVPVDTYWGTIGYHTGSTIEKVDEFLEKLKDIDGVAFNKQVPGKYFYYEIDQNGEIVTNTENSGYHFVKAFIFQYTGDDEEKFKEEIDFLVTPYFDDMYINVETYKGERIYNWD
ncbi:MAG: hypothetical protein AB2L24_10515 [Mangrovibacterium sp.]